MNQIAIEIINKMKNNIVFKLLKRLVFTQKSIKISPIDGFPYTSGNGIKIAHVSAYNYGNMGDTYLPVILKNLINNSIPVQKWYDIFVQDKVTPSIVRKINKCDLMIIGGGGLFLSDTHPNNVSGWQWNCDITMLKEIKTPIVMFAVGYNRFRGQEDFKPIFTEHLNRFVEQADFVGLRNHGSIERVKGYLKDNRLLDKVEFQPCMTTLTSLIYSSLLDYSHKENVIALNCAFDRSERRQLGNDLLLKLASVAKELSKIAKIKIFAHMKTDLQICPYLDSVGLDYETIIFNDVRQMLGEYSKASLVIGMRGHAQMIPFGCNTPILSIISHDKMKWFLNDIHHPEWGVDVLDPNFEKKKIKKAKYIYENKDQIIEEIKTKKKSLYNVTSNNLYKIRKILNK